MRKQFRVPTTYQPELDDSRRVDRKNSVIYGVVAMQAGEALGHDIWADDKTLLQAGMLSNAIGGGVPGRFGHPGMSENATGKKLSLAEQFRIDDDKLRFDMGFLESARKSPVFSRDPVDYMLTLAKHEPTQMGMSYVLYTDLVWTFDDGSERELTDEEYSDHYWGWGVEPPEGALTTMPVMRPTEVRFLDIVNEGALTSQDGLFEMSIASEIFSGRSSEYLVELFDLMDRFRAQYRIPPEEMARKADHIIREYIESRGNKMARKKAAAVELSADEFAEVAVLEPEVEEVVPDSGEPAEEPQDEHDSGIEDLESDMSSLMGDLSAQPEEPTVTASQLAHVQGQLALVLGTVDKQNSEIKRLTSLMRQSLEAIQMLHRNQQRLAGEAVVSETVSVAPTLGMDPVNFAHPEPSADIKSPVAGRKTLTEKDIAERNFKINAARQRQFGTPLNR